MTTKQTLAGIQAEQSKQRRLIESLAERRCQRDPLEYDPAGLGKANTEGWPRKARPYETVYAKRSLCL
jgi:hypothetical protein